MKRMALAAALLALAFSAGFGAAAERPVLVLNDTNDAPFTNPDGTGFLDAVAGEAFRRAGLELRLVRLPAERGLQLADKGIHDGDLARIAGMEQRYPNLVRVPEKLVDWEFAAFSKDRSIPATFDALRGRGVALIRGWKIYEQAMAGAENVVLVEDAEQLFRLLQSGRIDVALYVKSMGIAHISARGMSEIHLLQPLLASREMYIYLNSRHARHVPAIAAALRELKRDGIYRSLSDSKLKALLEKP